ncbi:hypothetical protein DXG01_000818 [Tephrocybe rancida]|nr:hypothetical protein DXG01_000818 [Tephrocybe rancida]
MDTGPTAVIPMSSSLINTVNPPAYAFLSKPPPPPQKKRPTVPPPPTPTAPFARKRSSTFTAIASWAAHVQPGSPGSPHSRRRASISRRPSISSRRSSPCTPSFIVIETPSPANKEFAIDLTDLGYTSVFVHLPKTPSTPAHTTKPSTPTVPAPAPARSMKRFRSLSILRPRNRTATATATLPPSPKAPTTSEPSPQVLAASIAKRKKATYAHAKASKSASKPQKPKPRADLPPSLAAELALMQFADGGSTEENIQRLMAAHARAAAPAGTKPSATTAVGDMYRDGRGGVWWDREEEMEYVHLLSGAGAAGAAGKEKWVSFGGEVRTGPAEEEDHDQGLAIASLADAGLGRRGSANSVMSTTSSLDPSNIIRPAEEDASCLRVPPLPLPLPARPTQPKENRPAPEPLLTIPSRPRHGHHLRARPNFFLLDLNAFSVPPTPGPRTPKTPRTPQTPGAPYPYPYPTHTHARARSSPTRPVFAHAHNQGQQRRRGVARRRPAPLNIVAHVPMRGVSPDLDAEAQDAREEFLKASFEPKVEAGPVAMHREAVYCAPAHVPAHQREDKVVRKKGSRALLSLFGRK